MPNKIETKDGKMHVELETGEVFDGDPLEVTTKLAETKVHTNKSYASVKAELDSLKANPPAPPALPAPVDANEVQLQNYLLEQTAKALGYTNAAEYRADLAKVKSTSDEVNNQLVASNFLSKCQDFPNTNEAIEALSSKIDENGWDFTPQSMIAAHALCTREGKYQPLTQEQITAQWSQNLQASNRPTPPPVLRSSSPDSAPQGGDDPWKMKLDDLRSAAIRQQLEGRA